MKVQNMTSLRGNKVPNQFIISNVAYPNTKESPRYGSMFQSYNSCIAFRTYDGNTFLDSYYWDYSTTTSKYRNQFLGETKKETQAKIDSGEYILTNLNWGDVMKKKFTVNACRWFDKVNGNTYHSVRITRHSDGKVIACKMIYGYEDHYKQTAITWMSRHKWIQDEYKGYPYLFERENNYPIIWNVSDGLKRDMVANGEV